MPISETRLAELRAAAEKAPASDIWAGGWEIVEHECDYRRKKVSTVRTKEWGQMVALFYTRSMYPGQEGQSFNIEKADELAAHIANCDPQTVIALIDEIEALRKALENIERLDQHTVYVGETVERVGGTYARAARRALTEGTAQPKGEQT